MRLQEIALAAAALLTAPACKSYSIQAVHDPVQMTVATVLSDCANSQGAPVIAYCNRKSDMAVGVLPLTSSCSSSFETTLRLFDSACTLNGGETAIEMK
ncbi:hypothetical protein COV82_04465 [Candidatus Peregrinibacteria bacterium CG11_big_fil_rev_8_21_14_0_20_46_8]|nr:MAG: hypothetical protein COV82_04465 [Candidatus Peregrinibacteria bacterium CG11_big_fil_rev_8_21_14_0_20_46_8]